MARPLKVFGGRYHRLGATHRCIVAAASKNAVRKIINASWNEVRDYWSETGNPAEIAIAMDKPGSIFVEERPFSGRYSMVPPR